MLRNLKDIEATIFNEKIVLLRLDYNVPITNGVVNDDTRIRVTVPTLRFLQKQNAKIVIFSHLGKVTSEDEKLKYSLLPVVKQLEEIILESVSFCPVIEGPELEKAINELDFGQILIVENTRFADLNYQRESKNSASLGKYWASLGDFFINDAFATAHRKHASTVGIASFLPNTSYYGFLIEREIKMLSKLITNPKPPFVAIMGGAKLSDKLTTIQNLLPKLDKLLIGGGMTYPFLKAKGYEIGKSLCSEQDVTLAKAILHSFENKIIIPVDCALSKNYANDEPIYRPVSAIESDMMGMDIGPETCALYQEILKDARTIVWNGPMGVFELENFAIGTNKIAIVIANLENVFAVAGGGDSTSAINKLNLKNAFSHVSTGGGAMLEFLSGKKLAIFR